MDSSDRECVVIDRLSDDQRLRLQNYLNGASIPFELTPSTVSVDADRVDDLYLVLQLVGDAPQRPHRDDPDDDTEDTDGADESAGVSTRPPLLAERTVFVHGRRVASPTRRFVGGFVDWIVLTAGTVAADRAGAPNWLIVTNFGLYVILTTALVGRTLGKLVVDTKVVSARMGRVPGFSRSTVRWLAVSWGAVLELAFGTWPIGVATAIFFVLVMTYAPILFDRFGRGLHDRAAGTIVVQTPR